MHQDETDCQATFNKLRRTPFTKVRIDIVPYLKTGIVGVEKYLTDNGWTYEEYTEAFVDYYVNRRSNIQEIKTDSGT